jgi:hypothetical protein
MGHGLTQINTDWGALRINARARGREGARGLLVVLLLVVVMGLCACSQYGREAGGAGVEATVGLAPARLEAGGTTVTTEPEPVESELAASAAPAGLEAGDGPLVRTPAFINPGHLRLGPWEKARFTPVPIAGTPEPSPRLTMYFSLVDAVTGWPVRGDVLVGKGEQGAEQGGDLIYQGVSQFTLELPGETGDDIIYVTVRAAGYKTWSQGYRYRLEHSRSWNLVVRLNPVGATPSPAPGRIGMGHRLPQITTDFAGARFLGGCGC